MWRKKCSKICTLTCQLSKVRKIDKSREKFSENYFLFPRSSLMWFFSTTHKNHWKCLKFEFSTIKINFHMKRDLFYLAKREQRRKNMKIESAFIWCRDKTENIIHKSKLHEIFPPHERRVNFFHLIQLKRAGIWNNFERMLRKCWSTTASWEENIRRFRLFVACFYVRSVNMSKNQQLDDDQRRS